MKMDFNCGDHNKCFLAGTDVTKCMNRIRRCIDDHKIDVCRLDDKKYDNWLDWIMAVKKCEDNQIKKEYTALKTRLSKLDEHGNALVTEFDYDWKIIQTLVDTGRPKLTRYYTQSGLGWSIYNKVGGKFYEFDSRAGHYFNAILIRPIDEMEGDIKEWTGN